VNECEPLARGLLLLLLAGAAHVSEDDGRRSSQCTHASREYRAKRRRSSSSDTDVPVPVPAPVGTEPKRRDGGRG
jgi:hypothetical protein